MKFAKRPPYSTSRAAMTTQKSPPLSLSFTYSLSLFFSLSLSLLLSLFSELFSLSSRLSCCLSIVIIFRNTGAMQLIVTWNVCLSFFSCVDYIFSLSSHLSICQCFSLSLSDTHKHKDRHLSPVSVVTDVYTLFISHKSHIFSHSISLSIFISLSYTSSLSLTLSLPIADLQSFTIYLSHPQPPTL